MRTRCFVPIVAFVVTCHAFNAIADDAGSAALKTSQAPAAARTAIPSHFNVREFGAAGDGKTDDTGPIQRAIDGCARQGGGVVVLDRGTFLTGTLLLQSHVDLHLTSTAVLQGVTDLAHYRADPKVVYKLLNQSLLFAEGCEHIAITGEGTIDGQGKAFRNGEKDQRPVLIRLRDCRDVRLAGFLVKNAASFGVHPIHCRQVRIEGLRIDSRVQPNSDGIDIDGCEDVFISNCNIRSGDDSIALKTIEHGAPCRDVAITNCILSSDCAAIRVGPDAVENIERVCASNCIIRDTRLNGIKIQMSFGAVMRDMVFSNMVMDNVTGPISIRLAGWKLGAGNIWAVFDDSNWEKGELRNILFENIRARVPRDAIKSCISIAGAPQTKPRGITFSNLDISFPGGGTAQEAARRVVPDLERDYPECFIFGVLPAYGLYVHHADGITLNNVQFHLEAGDLRPAVVCDDVQNLDLASFKADGDPKAESLVRLQDTQAALIAGARVLNPLGTFLRVEGERSNHIVLKGNDLDLAGKAVSVSEKVHPGAISTETPGLR
ncbi:MAG: glycoside hydrolase family 28 protein [Thermoguttaceae bacterium]